MTTALQKAFFLSLIVHSCLMRGALFYRRRRRSSRSMVNSNSTDPCSLSEIENADRVVPFTPTDVQNLFQFSCANGYHLRGRDLNVRTTNVYCLNGKVKPEKPTCQAARCQPTWPQPAHSQIQQSIQYGQVVNFTCDIGYLIDSPVFKQATGQVLPILCTETGKLFPSSSPMCKANTCTPPDIKLYNAKPLQEKMDVYDFDEKLDIVCQDGYTLPEHKDEKQTLECLADGTWSPKPQQCVQSDVPCDNHVDNAEVVRASSGRPTLMKVTCNDGYHVAGYALNVKEINFLCDINGEIYPSPKPSCDLARCKVHQIANATILPDPPQPGGIVNISCHEGFHITGKIAETTYAVVLCTESGDIVPALPSCKANLPQCIIPKSIYFHGHFQSAGSDVAYAGSYLTFFCDKGYMLSIPGNQKATQHNLFCTENGTWLTEPQACSPAAPDPSGSKEAWIENNYTLILLGAAGLLFIIILIGATVAVCRRRKTHLATIDCEHTSLISADSLGGEEQNGVFRKKAGGEDETHPSASVVGTNINDEAPNEHRPRLPRNKKKQAKVTTSSSIYASLSWSASSKLSTRSDCVKLNSRERSPQSAEEHSMSDLHYVHVNHAFSQQAQKGQSTGRRKQK